MRAFILDGSRYVVLLIGVIPLWGCATVGPQSITAGRGLYNQVINRTEDEQILNALVSLRYDETFGMTSVASVTAGLRFRTSAAAEVGVGDSQNYIGNLVPLSAGIAYEENPTISYVPLNGEDFMRRMISPLSLKEWVLMSAPISRKGLWIALAIQRLNGLDNSWPGRGAPPPGFVQFIELYGQLRRAAVVDVVRAPETDNGGSFSWYIHDYHDEHKDPLREMLDLVGIEATLDGSAFLVPIREAVGRSRSAIHLQTRSPYDILRVLGAGVDIPREHFEAGIAEELRATIPEKWKFIRIRSSENRPDLATVQIRLHDRWFYIDATDTQSKRAFLFLRTFIGTRLAETTGSQRRPVLTVPVN